MLSDVSFDSIVSETALDPLARYFKRVEYGSSHIIVTPWLPRPEKGDATKTFEEFDKIMDSWREIFENSTIKQDMPDLYDYELEQYEKAGPTSTMAPLDELQPKIEEYYSKIEKRSSPVDERAIRLTINKFKPSKFYKELSASKTLQGMKLSTNSGLPNFTTKSELIEDWMFHESNDEKIFNALNQGKVNSQYVSVLGHRTQMGGRSPEDSKQRIVFMFPFETNIKELSVYQQIIKGCQFNHIVPGWIGPKAVDAAITRLFDSKGKDDVVISTDFSSFDQHFNDHMSSVAKDVISNLFIEDATKWITEVFPTKYNIGLLVQPDKLYIGKHGMGSGSGGTNVDETIAHTALQFEVALKHGKQLNPNSTCLGDDGILTYPGIKVEDVVESYESHGQECNPEKQHVRTNTGIYLRRYYDLGYRNTEGMLIGVYPTFRALGKLCYMERFHKGWKSEDYNIRALSILENCNGHPLFHQFVDFAISKDHYRLGLDDQGFINKITSSNLKPTDLAEDQTTYVQRMENKPLKDWDVVKYLISKR